MIVVTFQDVPAGVPGSVVESHTYSKVPEPPEGSEPQVMALGLKEPQFDCGFPITPALVTLLQVTPHDKFTFTQFEQPLTQLVQGFLRA